MEWTIEYFEQEDTTLLHGYVKRVGQPTSGRDLKKAFTYWTEYIQTRRISPTQEED